MSRLPLLALCPLLLFVACTGEPPEGQGELPGESPSALSTTGEGVPLRQGDLRADLSQRQIPGEGSPDFREPTPEELQTFGATFSRMLSEGATPEVQQAFAGLDYSLTLYRDVQGTEYLVLEDTDTARNGGTFVVSLSPARDLIVEAPHSDSDAGTGSQSTALFFDLGARALLLNGVNRCASSDLSHCAEENTFCGNGGRTSDAAHHPFLFFTEAHRALRQAYPSALATSIHGMEAEGAEGAVISDGTRTPRPESISVRLGQALQPSLPQGKEAFSCNDAADDGRFRPLCGITNTQGRMDNASADACAANADSPSDRFLHIEQGHELRHQHLSIDEPDALAKALGQLVPCTLGGPGLGCTP